MQSKVRCVAIGVCFVLMNFVPGLAQDQTVPGAGNQNAVKLSGKSPLVQSAYRFLISQAGRINDSKLRKETLDAITNPETCIQHRAEITDADKTRILQSLITAGLVNVNDGTGFPGGLLSVDQAVQTMNKSCYKG